MNLDDFQDEASRLIEKIGALLPPGYKLTLLARHTTIASEKNADILLTRDDPSAVVASIERLAGKGS